MGKPRPQYFGENPSNRKRAFGFDWSLNEMIKYTDYKFLLAMLKLLSTVLCSESSPVFGTEDWLTQSLNVEINMTQITTVGLVNSNLCMILNSGLLNSLMDTNDL